MMKPITGQYECLHRSGVGLDYFTSRIDRLILQAGGRFVLTAQDRSRAANAVQSLLNGQQASNAAPETRREGSYTYQGNTVSLCFDDGTREEGQLSLNDASLQIGATFFTKVSDSTLLPPAQRLQQNVEDIAKGIKLASTIGGMAIKAVKTIQDTMQTTQGPMAGQGQSQSSPSAQGAVPSASPVGMPVQAVPNVAYPPPQGDPEALFCDQCGARQRVGKRFCNSCGAQLD